MLDNVYQAIISPCGLCGPASSTNRLCCEGTVVLFQDRERLCIHQGRERAPVKDTTTCVCLIYSSKHNRLIVPGLTLFSSLSLTQVTHKIHQRNLSNFNTQRISKSPSSSTPHSMIPKPFSLLTTACIFSVHLSAA